MIQLLLFFWVAYFIIRTQLQRGYNIPEATVCLDHVSLTPAYLRFLAGSTRNGLQDIAGVDRASIKRSNTD